MSSFMQRARDRAQEAAARAQSLAQDGAARLNASSSGGSSSSPAASGKAPRPSSPGGTPAGVSGYSGSLPHVLRQGLAQYYPRSDSDSRANYILKNALKGMILDHAATARETKTAAHATYSWGLEQDPQKSEEGQGDAALVDVADRLAFMLQTISDLEQAHVGRAENARATFKRIAKAERELAPKRERRAKLRRELHTLMPEQAKGNSERIAPLQQRLKEWQEDDREEEEELGRLKRECLRDSYEAHFDSLIELGEKLAIVARHGKLLTHQIPLGTPVYPAPRHEGPWAGASRTAAIRAALPPALAGYQPGTQLPELPAEQLASGTSGASSLHSADTRSYGESHAEELSLFNQGTQLHDDEHDSHDAGLGGGVASASALPHSSGASTHSALAPGSLGGGSASPSLLDNINNGPAQLPPSPSAGHGAATRHRVPPLPSPSAGGSSGSGAPQQYETDVRGDLADGPSVAETGKPIVGPGGPSSGTLQPRVPRRSSAASTGTASNPFGDSASAGAGSSAQADAHARKEAEAAQERKEAEARREREEVAAQSVQARMRRDGTVVRRGEAGYEEAEEEGLPAYHV